VNGSAHDTSDLDLVLRSEHLTRLDSEEWAAFKAAVEESTIPILIQAFDWANMPASFHDNILRQYAVLKSLS